ncbi:MAG: TIGR00730 family Rossman fold protein [Flavobacteriaceae bacterium]|nr:TIGR00730 family Rossman fold protein [Flavobacteriaceae bacterium]
MIEKNNMSRMILDMAAKFEGELIKGFEAVQKYPKTVTFFDSSRFQEDNKHYQVARELSALICKEDYTVITGGGGGIMEAGNRGSKEECGTSVGFNIELPMEQATNEYVTHGVSFNFFASRKMAMYFSGEAYIFFPGGYGTLDEFFQILTLIQTQKIEVAPIICVGAEYWNSVNDLIVNTLMEEGTISEEDPSLYTITDDLEEVLRIIQSTSH